MSVLRSTVLLLGLLAAGATTAHALGSGGRLVRVPYAVVKLNNEPRTNWQVFVHPMESSWVVFAADGNVYAMDRAKNHTASVNRNDILSTEWPYVTDAPSTIPYKVHKRRPHFGRYYVRTRLDDGSLLEVEVGR